MKERKVNVNYPLHTFNDVKDIYSLYIANKKDRDLIEKSYKYAERKHLGVFRNTGEPYIHHPIEVAYILACLHVGPKTIISGFIHDVVEDTDTTIEEIGKLFGKEVQTIVDALTKIDRLKLSHNENNLNLTAEDHKKILIGMAKDIRVILIKLADRLHNMRTLTGLPLERIERLSKETLEVFVPIAHRLGLYAIQSEMEDLALQFLKPDVYEQIQNLLNKKMRYRKKSLDVLMKKVADMLFEKHIPFEITSRVKSVYSIYKKIYLKGHTFDEIYDIMAIRIITDTELRCYEIIGMIHAVYKPIPGRFKDYIAVPKANMYQSLHSSIVTGDGSFYEVQVRTKEMDEIAETGVAAHWKYKEGVKRTPKQEMHEIENKLHWFRDFVAMSAESISDSGKEYMDNLRHDIFESSVYAITPLGKVIDLPAGSTPLDFAYKIHSKIGDQAVGAIVNNNMVSLNTILKSGDVVEIRTNPNSKGPNEGWLKIVKSANALSHIRKALAKKNSSLLKDERIMNGRNSLKEAFAQNGFGEEEMMIRLNNKKLFEHYNVESLDDLFIGVSNRNPMPNDIFKFLHLKDKRSATIKLDKAKKLNESPVIVGGEARIAVSLGNCCSPLPGDEIVGYVTKGKGITIHRINCPNVKGEKERIVNAKWREEDYLSIYPVDIEIEANDRVNLLTDIMGAISQHKISVTAINAHVHRDTMTSIINATIHVNDAKKLHDIFNVILNVQGVFRVSRIIH